MRTISYAIIGIVAALAILAPTVAATTTSAGATPPCDKGPVFCTVDIVIELVNTEYHGVWVACSSILYPEPCPLPENIL